MNKDWWLEQDRLFLRKMGRRTEEEEEEEERKRRTFDKEGGYSISIFITCIPFHAIHSISGSIPFFLSLFLSIYS